jgi:hypothetical protein
MNLHESIDHYIINTIFFCLDVKNPEATIMVSKQIFNCKKSELYFSSHIMILRMIIIMVVKYLNINIFINLI